MSDQYSLYWKLNADSSNFNKNVSSAQKSLSGLQGAFQKIQKFTVAGIVGTAGLKAIRELKKVIDETTAAYRTQINAENALAVALKNNIKTSELSAKAMKDYASALSSASNYGDEELLPMISKLIASGRTEAEAMKIMSAAVNLAAGANMSLDSAVEQLNGTINGNIGRLGRQNAELKNLTAEELASGKAVDIIAKKYEGMAKKTQDSSKLLKNAIGDYKELAGETFEKALSPMRKYFAELLQNHITAIKSARALKDAEKGVFYEEDAGKLQEQYDIVKAQVEDYRKKIRQVKDEQRAKGGRTENFAMDMFNVQQWQSAIDSLTPKLQELFQKITDIKKKEKELAQAEAEAIEQAKAEEAVKSLLDLQNEYLDAIKAQEKAWLDSEAVTGEAVSLEEKRTFYQNKLLDIMTASNGQINAGTQYYQNQMSIISGLTQEIEAQRNAVVKVSQWDDKLAQQRNENLDKNSKAYHEYIRNIISLEYEKTLAAEENEEERRKITEYYANKQIAEYNRYEQVKRNKTKETLKAITEYTKKTFDAVKSVLVSGINTLKSVFSDFTSLINLDFDDLLDRLLAFEDRILTFFVVTLPKLPSYFKSAIESIAVTLEQVAQIITPEKISSLLIDIMQAIQSYAPGIIDNIAGIITDVIDGLIEAVPDILDTMQTVVETLAERMPELIQKLIDFVISILKEPEKIASLVVTLINGVVEIVNVLIRNLPELLAALLPAVGQIFIELIKALPNWLLTMAAEVGKATLAIAKWVVNLIIDGLNTMLDGISYAWTWIPGTSGIPHIPHFANGTDNASRGLALVGEAGPELVRFNGGEQVLNAKNTQKALAGTGGNTNNFNVTFNNLQDTTAYQMMSQLKQYQRNLAFNGVL